MLSSISDRTKTFYWVLRNCKDWPLWLAYHFGFAGKDQEHFFSMRNGLRFIFKNNELYMLKEILMNGDYTKYQAIRRGQVVVDIGANIGLFSISSALIDSNITIYSYEPDPGAYSRLMRNIEYNKLDSQIHAFDTAIAGRSGSALFYVNPVSSTASTFFNNQASDREKVEVRVKTLPQILEENNIDVCNFLKIDCEGAETDILYSTPKVYFDRIDYISLEYHNDNGEDLSSLLNKMGFKTKLVKNTNLKNLGMIYAKK